MPIPFPYTTGMNDYDFTHHYRTRHSGTVGTPKLR
nr:MAG TPA: hypothetical protein [Caudoviricetes sp.]